MECPNTITNILIVGSGGFIGAIGRYGLGGVVHRITGPGFPYGTLFVNVAGCLLIGAVSYLVEFRSAMSPQLRLFLTIGVLGGFTTFSSFGYETLALARDGQFTLGLANIAANIMLGLGAVWLGRVMAAIVL